MKSILLALTAFSLVALFGCTTPEVKQTPAQKYHLTGGVKEVPFDDMGCWVQPPQDTLWYPCGQKTDEELGKHGH